MSSTEVAPQTAAALLDAVRETSGVRELDYAEPPVSLQGGYYAEMIRFALTGAPPELSTALVARIIPNPAAARWEAVLQGGVASQGFPTPAVRLTADDTSPLGRSLLVMDHVEGASMLSGLDGAGIVRQIPALLHGLPDQLAGLAASLHALDPDHVAAGLDALDDGIPTTTRGFVEAQLWLAAVADRADLVEAAEQLISTEPPSRRRVISHGDLHPFNVLEAASGPVLIDWTVARVAHPGFTLGFTDLMLSHPPIEVPRAATPALHAIGRRIARRFHRAYRSLAAPEDLVTSDELAWHRKVHELRIVVELAGWEAAGTMPTNHPWLLMRPIVERDLGLVRSP